MFVAGFETVSTTLSFCLYELALKKDIQDKVRDEIKSLMLKNNGVIDNDLLINLNYLDMVLAGRFLILYFNIVVPILTTHCLGDPGISYLELTLLLTLFILVRDFLRKL